jgi:hypothetical protein
MRTITTLEDLTALKDEIRSVNKDIVVTTPQRTTLFGLFATQTNLLPLDAEKICEHNKELYKKLPETIEISAELAQIMTEQLIDYASEKDALDKQHKPISKIIGATLSHIGAMAMPSPLHIAIAAQKTKEAIIAAQNHSNERNSLDETQNITTAAVLGAYLLSEPEPDKFVLTRGSWKVSRESSPNGRGTTEVYMIRPIDTTLDCVEKHGLIGESNYFAKCACGYEGLAEPKSDNSAAESRTR